MIEPTTRDEAAILALNNAHAVETSLLTPEGLRALLAAAYRARLVPPAQAFSIAFDQSGSDQHPHLNWFRARNAKFVYVDRVVVAEAARGKGLARALYADLTEAARRDGHTMLCCEVNLEPPNPVSDAFHSALGFEAVGKAVLADRGKTVRYLRLAI